MVLNYTRWLRLAMLSESAYRSSGACKRNGPRTLSHCFAREYLRALSTRSGGRNRIPSRASSGKCAISTPPGGRMWTGGASCKRPRFGAFRKRVVRLASTVGPSPEASSAGRPKG
jgi:hypothetical protein